MNIQKAILLGNNLVVNTDGDFGFSHEIMKDFLGVNNTLMLKMGVCLRQAGDMPTKRYMTGILR